MATKHTYTATAQDGTVHTRTTARTKNGGFCWSDFNSAANFIG